MSNDITALTRYGINEQGVFTNQSDGAYVSYQDYLALVEALEARDKQIAKDVEIKARLCRESNSLFDRLRAAEKRIAELEKAASEPVAWVRYCSDGTIDGPLMNYQIEDCRKSTWTPLYTAPPAPVVPGVREQWIADVVEYLEGGLEADGELEAEGSIEAKRLLSRRAAMLQESQKGAGAPQNCRSNEKVQVLDRQSVDHVDGESCCGNSPVTPGGWIPVSERMPDPQNELRVCVYTPTEHKDVRYRFISADLFKAVCGDATHWRYMTAPVAPKEVG